MLSNQVRAFADEAWARFVDHAFFAAIGDGSLSLEQLRFWLEQDLPYLADYESVRTKIAARVNEDPAYRDLAEHVAWDEWVDQAGEGEVAFEYELLALVGAGRPVIGRFEARPSREAYMNHIVRVGHEGTIGEMIAALLPCDWGFTETGGRLETKAESNLHPAFALWIEYYTSPAQRANTETSISVLDRAGTLADAAERDRIGWIFLRSVQHQIAVLDAAWRVADPWPEEREALAVRP